MIICPKCQCSDSRVKETKPTRMENCIVRYRTCLGCYHEFCTHERAVLLVRKGPKPKYSVIGGSL
jgi:transcriptional regulator NrdR family protein